MGLSIVRSVAKALHAIGREFRYFQPRPRTATLALTERCNLRCKSCGVWQLPARKQDELDLPAIRRILRELRVSGVRKVALIDGEPLLRPDIVEIVQEITSLGMDSEMTTNAALLKKEKALRLVDAGLGRVMVSIDAPNTVHDELRGAKGSFARAVEGVRHLIWARNNLGRLTPVVLINSLLTAQNVDYLNMWLELVSELGADGINFFYPTFMTKDVHDAGAIRGEQVSSGRFLDFDRSLLIPASRMREVLPQLKKIRSDGARRGITVWLSPDLFLCSLDDFEKGRVPMRKCYFIRTNVIVSAYGDVTPCALMDRYSYGSLLNEPLDQVWLNGRHMELLDEVRKGLPICANCRCHFGSNLTVAQQLKRKLQFRA